MLANLKGKLRDTFKDLAGQPDPYGRRITDLVERATSDLLPSPDWGLNMELVDVINADPLGATDKVVNALRRALLKLNTHTQLLTITCLETCVRNCLPQFYEHLIRSDLWSDIMRIAEPGQRCDPEVRDRLLGLVEDFGRGLPLAAYRDAYEGLVIRGVDFPVRQPHDEAAPYYSPPQLPPARTAAATGSGAGPSGAEVGGDLSAEDRAAIASAMADLEREQAEEDARQAALAPPGMPLPGHVPAMMGPAMLMGAPIRPPGYHPPAGYTPLHTSAAPAMVAGASPLPAAVAPGATASPDGAAGPGGEGRLRQALAVAHNSAELLAEMLAPVLAGSATDPAGAALAAQEPLVADLAQQCYRYRSVLQDAIPGSENAALVSEALAANDELQRVLLQYEALARPGSGGGREASSSGGAGAPAGGNATGTAPAPPLPVANFTLLGDDEEEEGGSALATRREVAAPAAAAAGSGTGDLISFDQVLPAVAPPLGGPAGEGLVAPMGGLQLGAGGSGAAGGGAVPRALDGQ